MLTEKQKRCQDCFALVEGDSHEWVCDEYGKNIEEIEVCGEFPDYEEGK